MSESLCPEFIEREQQVVLPGESDARCGVIVYGLPGIGRTKLLLHIKRRGDPDPNLRIGQDPLPSHYCPIFLSRGHLPIKWGELLGKITAQTRLDYPDRDKVISLESLYRQAQWHNATRTRGATLDPTVGPDATVDTGDSVGAREISPEKLTWLDYFDHLYQNVPEFRILFLIDGLDQTAYSKPPTDFTQVNSFHLLQFAISSPSAWIIATSSKELGSGVQIDSFLSDFRQYPLKPLKQTEVERIVSAGSEDMGFAEEVFKWTGGIAPLVCTLLDYYDYGGASPKISPKNIRRWQATDVKPWYDKVRNYLAASAEAALERIASKEPYVNDRQKNSAERRVIKGLVKLGLVEEEIVDDNVSTFRIPAKGLKSVVLETLKEESASDLHGLKRLSLRPFTTQKLQYFLYATMFLSIVTIVFLNFQTERDPILGLVWLLAPALYGLYGVYHLYRDDSSRSDRSLR